jgi:hypothetical protein
MSSQSCLSLSLGRPAGFFPFAAGAAAAAPPPALFGFICNDKRDLHVDVEFATVVGR